MKYLLYFLLPLIIFTHMIYFYFTELIPTRVEALLLLTIYFAIGIITISELFTKEDNVQVRKEMYK